MSFLHIMHAFLTPHLNGNNSGNLPISYENYDGVEWILKLSNPVSLF